MNAFGNFLWIVFGGLFLFVLYFLYGLVLCVTIVGIPFGVQLMKLGFYALLPFGRTVHSEKSTGCLNLGFNVLWILFGWWELALFHLVLAVVFAITIVGIPFAKQHFKLIQISLLPFGTKFS